MGLISCCRESFALSHAVSSKKLCFFVNVLLRVTQAPRLRVKVGREAGGGWQCRLCGVNAAGSRGTLVPSEHLAACCPQCL